MLGSQAMATTAAAVAERSRLVALERHTALLALSFLDPTELACCTRLCKRWALPYHHMLWRAHCAATGMDVQNQNQPPKPTASAAAASTSQDSKSAPQSSAPATSLTATTATDARFYYRTFCEVARHLVFPIVFPPATARLIDDYTSALGPSLFRRCRVMCAPNAVSEAHHLIAVLLSVMFPAPPITAAAAATAASAVAPASTSAKAEVKAHEMSPFWKCPEWVELGLDETEWRRFERWSVVCSKIVQSYTDTPESLNAEWKSYIARLQPKSESERIPDPHGWEMHLASVRASRLVHALWSDK
jgi:hypothetical protein